MYSTSRLWLLHELGRVHMQASMTGTDATFNHFKYLIGFSIFLEGRRYGEGLGLGTGEEASKTSKWECESMFRLQIRCVRRLYGLPPAYNHLCPSGVVERDSAIVHHFSHAHIHFRNLLAFSWLKKTSLFARFSLPRLSLGFVSLTEIGLYRSSFALLFQFRMSKPSSLIR